MSPPTPKFVTHDQLRAALEPAIRQAKILHVAAQAGISQPALSAWVNGRADLSDETITRVAAVVGFQVEPGYKLTRRQ